VIVLSVRAFVVDAYRLGTLLRVDGYPFVAVLVPQNNQVAVVFSHVGKMSMLSACLTVDSGV